jgi:MFS family permease
MTDVSNDGARFSRTVRILLVGQLFSAVGSGITIPYLFVYLHQELGLAGGLVGALLIVRAVGAVVGAALAGAAADRVGAKPALVWGLGTAATASGALALIGDPMSAAAAMAAFGVTMAAAVTAGDALLGQVTPVAQRPRAFSSAYLVTNLGGAGGATLAALFLAVWPDTLAYRTLFAVDASSFAVFGILVARLVLAKRPAPAHHGQESHDPKSHVPETRGPAVAESAAMVEPDVTDATDVTSKRTAAGTRRAGSSGYRAVLADPALRWLAVIIFVLVSCGHSQLEVGLPVFAADQGIDTAGLGWVFAANMITIVVFQTPVQRLSSSSRRTSSLLVAIGLIVVAWTVLRVAVAGGTPIFVAVGAIFAIAEVVLSPVLAATVNDLAPPGLRGRYNGVHTMAWTGGWLAGTVTAAALLGFGGTGLLLPLLIVVLLAATPAVFRLRRALPAGLDRPASIALDHPGAAPDHPASSGLDEPFRLDRTHPTGPTTNDGQPDRTTPNRVIEAGR